MLIKSMKMLWKSFSWRLFQNVEKKPGFQKTIAIGKHLDVSGNHRHRTDADIPRHNPSVDENQKRVKPIQSEDQPISPNEVMKNSNKITQQKNTRKPKSGLHIFWMSLVQNRSCATELINLF